jgi:hypothetical protein
MAKIEIKREQRADWDVLHYVGPMDEEAGLHLLNLYETVRPNCVFNFAGLTSVNSKGIAAWMNFIRDFRENRRVAFEECPESLVSQINMIPSVALQVDVRSVFAGFECAACGNKPRRLIKLALDAQGHLPEAALMLTCDRCRAPMEMDEDPDDYFMFLTRPKGR